MDWLRWTSYCRGNGSGLNNSWPNYTTHDFHDYANASTTYLIPALQAKTGLMLDLPTHTMWEYACRAGTTTATYTGNAQANEYGKIGRFKNYNQEAFSTTYPPRDADLSVGSNIVGSYLPNAYGLYDMMGNVAEWCLDRYLAPANLASITWGQDPVGPTSADQTANGVDTKKRIVAGGSYMWNAGSIYGDTGAKSMTQTDHTVCNGVRLCLWLTNHEDGTL